MKSLQQILIESVNPRKNMVQNNLIKPNALNL